MKSVKITFWMVGMGSIVKKSLGKLKCYFEFVERYDCAEWKKEREVGSLG